MSTPVASAADQLRLCQLQERRLQRQLDSSESVLAQQQERLQMCGEQVAEVEKSGAADMIDQLDQLCAQEETLDSDIWCTQDTIMDLRYQPSSAQWCGPQAQMDLIHERLGLGRASVRVCVCVRVRV